MAIPPLFGSGNGRGRVNPSAELGGRELFGGKDTGRTCGRKPLVWLECL